MSGAETFAEVVVKADLSNKPLSWRYFDLSRFHFLIDPAATLWEDVEVEVAKIIEIEMRLGSWARRLSLRVTIDDDIEDTAEALDRRSSSPETCGGLQPCQSFPSKYSATPTRSRDP